MEKLAAVKILNSKKIVGQGAAQVKCTNVVPYTRSDGTQVNIASFDAMTEYHKNQALDFLRAGDYQDAANEGLSASLRVGKDYDIQKGEVVKVVLDYITNKNGEQALVITSVSGLAAQRPKSFDFGVFEKDLAFQTEEVEEEVDEEETALAEDQTIAFS